MDLPDASSRPSRLSVLAHVVVVGALLLSFISGIAVWYGQNLAEHALAPPAWLRPSRLLHGGLNPILCGVFGYLCCQHIRYGWALRANWLSGFTMEAVFLFLILSALPVYYAGDGAFRHACVFVHRVFGAALPAVLIVHWMAARVWVKKNLKPTCN
jgi:hypothetical protein